MDINNTNFPLQVKEFVSKIVLDKNDFLKSYQRIVHDIYMHLKRGILAYWKMGTGKTRLALSLMLSSQKKAVCILNKALMPDFMEKLEKVRTALEKLGKETKALDTIKFVSMNASNVLEQLKKGTTALGEESLDDTFIIVDEAHHFFNAITNESKNALELYQRIKKSKNSKMVFLTGTPITKDIWEIVPCFNMIAGFELLPENREDFYKLFGEGQNMGKLENRLMGMVSYYELTPEESLVYLPRRQPTQVVKVELTPFQMSKYASARSIELEEAQFASKKQAGPTIRNNAVRLGSNFSTSYRARSRQFSNMVAPDHAYGQDARFDAELLTDEDCAKMHIYSPKLVAMFDNIEKMNKELGQVKQFCYSGYNEYGIKIFVRYAKYKGWLPADGKDADLKSSKGKFAIISGEMHVDERGQSVKYYNLPGHFCDLLFVTKTGSEGFDFKGSRACHIFEYFWHDSIIQQIIARGDRLDSHTHLPEKDREITPFIYLTTIPKSYDKEDLSTDEYIYQIALERAKVTDSILRLMKRVSINCTGECKVCSPTNRKLYELNIMEDMKNPDPCMPIKEAKTIVKELLYDGKKYYYNDKKDIFIFNEELNKYLHLDINNPVYSIIYNMIS